MKKSSQNRSRDLARWTFIFWLIFTQFVAYDELSAQSSIEYPKYYDEAVYAPKIDSLRELYGKNLSFKFEKKMELAALLALSHYPELQNRKVKMVIRDVKGEPVEASFSPFNFIKSRKNKVYKIIIQKGSFMERLDLNRQVAALGHEMAHFVQYDERGYFNTLITLLGYVMSDKKRMRFEKAADKLAIDHMLGPQLLDFSFYTSDQEIRSYMDAKGYEY